MKKAEPAELTPRARQELSTFCAQRERPSLAEMLCFALRQGFGAELAASEFADELCSFAEVCGPESVVGILEAAEDELKQRAVN
ncbi:MAG TPA: hypothetical protein VF789_04160 [Thermoanaerobaculia bacterium]